MIRSCGVRTTFLRPRPSAAADPSSELLPGEEMAVLEVSGGWAWGYSRHDHYVGYVEAIELVEAPPPTHLIAAREASIFPEADANVPALASLPMGSRVTGREANGFLLTEIGFLSFTNVRELGAIEHDPVTVAERLIGAPYLMGGRTSSGIDCSGLVQLSLALCGIPAPRDSDQQRVLGTPLDEDAALKRGISFSSKVTSASWPMPSASFTRRAAMAASSSNRWRKSPPEPRSRTAGAFPKGYISPLALRSARHRSALALCSWSVRENTWPPVPSAT
jgi:hypothetical protein